MLKLQRALSTAIEHGSKRLRICRDRTARSNEFFLNAVSESAQETIAVAGQLQDLHQRYREQFQTARRSALTLRIIDLAFERPAMSVGEIARTLGVSYQGAANPINELLTRGVALEVPNSYPKLVSFPEIIESLHLRNPA